MTAKSRLLLMLLAGALTLGTAAAKHGADDPPGDDRGGTRQNRGGADDPAGHDAGDDKGGLNKAQRAALCQTAAVKADPGLWAKYECADISRRSVRPHNQFLAKHGADDPTGDDHGQHAPVHAKLPIGKLLLARHGADDPAGDDHGQHGPGHA